MLERMGYLEDEDEEEVLEFFEFEAVFARLTEDFMPEEVDSYIMIQLGAPHLKHYDSRQKAQLVFAKLDEDRSGELELNEIVLLAKMLDPMAEEARIKKAVAYLDTDNSETVDSREFVEAMSQIFDNTDTAHVDAAITKILEIGVDAMDLATCHMSKALKYAPRFVSTRLFQPTPLICGTRGRMCVGGNSLSVAARWQLASHHIFNTLLE
jgi:hypothetical protein